MSASSCPTIPASAVGQVLATNATILSGPINQVMAPNAPWLNSLDSGTFPANTANQLTSVAQGISMLGTSAAAPTFQDFSSTCGPCTVGQTTSGSQQFNYTAGIYQDVSGPICLTAGYLAMKDALIQQVRAVASAVQILQNGDVQYQMYLQCGIKVIAQTNAADINTMVYGGMYQYAVAVPAVPATAPMSFSLLNAVNGFMVDQMFMQGYENGNSRLICGYNGLEAIRNELGGAASTTSVNIVPLGQVAAGGNKTAIDGLLDYAFLPIMRGVEYGLINQPLRLNYSGGTYTPVNPWISTNLTNGTAAAPNPAYHLASHEVSFLLYKSSGMTAFKREVPENYTGDGKIRFGNQMFGGDIRFTTDNIGYNPFLSYGVLAYQVGRAYRPQIPWACAAIIWKRCIGPVLGGCTGVSA